MPPRRAPPATPRRDAARTTATATLLVAALRAADAVAAPPAAPPTGASSPPAPSMKADAPDPALQIATRGLRAERPDATARLVRRWDRLPGVFVLEVAPGDERWVIVLDDDVDLARGLAPACRYLTTLGTRRAAALQVGDLFALFEAYEAWPTPPNDVDYPPANRPFWSRGALPEADPKLRVSAHRLTWTVSYERASPIPPEVQVGAARGGAGARTFWRWTLTLREGAAPETSAELTSVPARHAR